MRIRMLPVAVAAVLLLAPAAEAKPKAGPSADAKTSAKVDAAEAKPDEAVDAKAAAPNRLFLHGDAYGGFSHYDQAGNGVVIGADVLARWRFLQAGLMAESSSGRKETIGGYGVLAGLAYYKHPAIGFDLVGGFGFHKYDHVGAELAAVGAHGDLAFLRVQAGVTFLPLKPFTFGVWAYYGDDLVRANRSYAVPNNAPGAAPLSAQTTLGEPSYGAMLRIGFDLGL